MYVYCGCSCLPMCKDPVPRRCTVAPLLPLIRVNITGGARGKNNTITFGKNCHGGGDEDVGERRVIVTQPVNTSLYVLVFVQLSG